MGFADATVAHLAKWEVWSATCTIDHNDFETYCIEKLDQG